MNSISQQPVRAAFTASAYKSHIIAADTYVMEELKALKDFYRHTQGRERLLQARIEKLHIDVAKGNAAAVVMQDRATGAFAGASACHFYDDDLCELSSVLIDPAHTGRGLYPAMRLAQNEVAGKRTQLLVERLPLKVHDEQVALRAAEGWSVLPADHPICLRVEAEKAKRGWISPEEWPPKTTFARAASGTQLALPDTYGNAGLIPAANRPAFAGVARV